MIYDERFQNILNFIVKNSNKWDVDNFEFKIDDRFILKFKFLLLKHFPLNDGTYFTRRKWNSNDYLYMYIDNYQYSFDHLIIELKEKDFLYNKTFTNKYVGKLFDKLNLEYDYRTIIKEDIIGKPFIELDKNYEKLFYCFDKIKDQDLNPTYTLRRRVYEFVKKYSAHIEYYNGHFGNYTRVMNSNSDQWFIKINYQKYDQRDCNIELYQYREIKFGIYRNYKNADNAFKEYYKSKKDKEKYIKVANLLLDDLEERYDNTILPGAWFEKRYGDDIISYPDVGRMDERKVIGDLSQLSTWKYAKDYVTGSRSRGYY